MFVLLTNVRVGGRGAAVGIGTCEQIHSKSNSFGIAKTLTLFFFSPLESRIFRILFTSRIKLSICSSCLSSFSSIFFSSQIGQISKLINDLLPKLCQSSSVINGQ